MVDETHGDFPRPTASDIARRLMESARQDPALLGRLRPGLAASFDPTGTDMFLRPAVALPAAIPDAPQVTLYQQCEQLASVAVAAAQDAEDALQRARSAFHSARRAMLVCGALGLAGLAVAIAAVFDTHTVGSTTAQAPVADPPPAYQPASAPDPSTGTAAMHAVYVPPLPTPTGITKPPEVPAAAPTPPQAASAPPMVTYASSAPWPSSRPLIYRQPYPRQHVVYPPFYFALRRDIHLLFRMP
jgi:hypothetical protein